MLNRLELDTVQAAESDRYRRIDVDPKPMDGLLLEVLESHVKPPQEDLAGPARHG